MVANCVSTVWIIRDAGSELVLAESQSLVRRWVADDGTVHAISFTRMFNQNKQNSKQKKSDHNQLKKLVFSWEQWCCDALQQIEIKNYQLLNQIRMLIMILIVCWLTALDQIHCWHRSAAVSICWAFWQQYTDSVNCLVMLTIRLTYVHFIFLIWLLVWSPILWAVRTSFSINFAAQSAMLQVNCLHKYLRWITADCRQQHMCLPFYLTLVELAWLHGWRQSTSKRRFQLIRLFSRIFFGCCEYSQYCCVIEWNCLRLETFCTAEICINLSSMRSIDPFTFLTITRFFVLYPTF